MLVKRGFHFVLLSMQLLLLVSLFFRHCDALFYLLLLVCVVATLPHATVKSLYATQLLSLLAKLIHKLFVEVLVVAQHSFKILSKTILLLRSVFGRVPLATQLLQLVLDAIQVA